MQQIENTIRILGQKRNTPDLQTYVSKIDVDEIKLIITKRLNTAEFTVFWNYLLQGLDREQSQEKRYDIVNSCIEQIRKRDVSTQHTNSIITRLCMELPKFLTTHLVSLCVLCMGFIQKGDVTEACWKELLPELLNVLIERQCVEFNLNEMSGTEFKTQYINSLCMLNWPSNTVIPLTVMFIEMPLSKEEHLQVTYKLVEYIEKLAPQEIPSFIYQILRFCQSQNSKLIFHKLQEYFHSKIYNNSQEGGSNSSESLISDCLDDDYNQAESTVLYHIYQSALLGHENIKDYIFSLRNLSKSPEFILHPFQLNVLLTVSNVSFYEEKVFELIRQSISRYCREEIRKNESNWLRTLVPHALNLEDRFLKIVQNSSNDRDLVVQGLVNLGFVLLGVGALLGRETLIAKKQWNLGKFVLLNLVKEKQHMAHVILQKLCHYIVIGNNSSQYIDCFRDFSIKFTYITLENKSCIIELMETLISTPESYADSILDIVIRLIKISSTLRDNLILLLRKALYSRSAETRQIAVKGFLKVLAKLKISNLTALSQINCSGSSSTHSVLTQISLHRSGHPSDSNAFSNEALCLEMLNILKRCYLQQADVRSKLYGGLGDVINQNQDLVSPVLTLLWSHFLKYHKENEDELPPVDFSKLSIIRDTEVVVQEPISHLLSTISLLIVKYQELEDEAGNAQKFITLLDSFCDRLIRCELVHFELHDNISLLDNSIGNKKNIAILKEAMSLYESCIGYKMWSWKRSSDKHAQKIIQLFQGYFRLQHCAKDATRSKKIDKKKKEMNKITQQNRTTQQSATQTSQTQQNLQDSTSSSKASKTTAIKLPATVLELKVLIRFLTLLHENVSWAAPQEMNQLKVKQDIHQHVMQAIIYKLQNTSISKSLDHRREYYDYCLDIARIIYPRCIKRLHDFIEFDATTASLAVDCFHIILNIICTNYPEDLGAFLSVIEEKNQKLSHNLMLLIRRYQKLFESQSSEDQTLEYRKITEIVGSTLTLLVCKISVNQEPKELITWLKEFATENVLKTKTAAKLFATIWFSTYIKYRSTISVFEEVVENLREIFGCSYDKENEKFTKLNIINEQTADIFVESLSNALKTLLDNVEWMISRLRSDYGVLTFAHIPSEEKKQKLMNKEKDVCCQLCFIINLVEDLCTVRVSVALGRVITENVLLLYNILNSLTKYFIMRSSKVNPAFQNARFERVVKLASTTQPAWHELVVHIEASQLEEIGNAQVKKKNSSTLKNKVIKETKSIPKTVCAIEQFNKSIIQLSNKTKHDLSKYIGVGTTRDFRIKNLKDVIKNTSVDAAQSEDESSNLSTVYEDVEENSNDDESPPSKRART